MLMLAEGSPGTQVPTVAEVYRFVVGVDTHAKVHQYAIVEAGTGRVLDEGGFPTSGPGLARAAAWIARRTGGDLESVLVSCEGTGSYGARSEQVLTRTRQWFHDPLSAATRAQQVAVPRRPNKYPGPLRHTTETARSYDGSVAMPATSLYSRKLQSGQAASFGFGPLFAYNSTVLSAGGRIQVQSLVRSLTYVTAVTCEGFADYGGRKKWGRPSSPSGVRPSSARHCVPTARTSRLPCAVMGAQSLSPSVARVPAVPRTDVRSCASPGASVPP